MKLLSRALAGRACYNIPNLAIPDQDLRTIRSKVKTPGDLAAASPARRLVSLMPFASDRSQPGPVDSPDPGASSKLAYGFSPGAHPGNRQPRYQTASATSTQYALTWREPMCQQLSPRPKRRGTPRVFGRGGCHRLARSMWRNRPADVRKPENFRLRRFGIGCRSNLQHTPLHSG
jgi:hypothetical protein